MKTLIVYDSFFGNTEKLALAMRESLASLGEAQALRAGQAKAAHLAGVHMLIVGSPTRAFRPTRAVSGFLAAVPAGVLDGVRTAAFDTRISPADVGSRLLKVLVGFFGYAAEPMAAVLSKKGGREAAPAEGFYVVGSKGPLKEGELERAKAWALRAAG